MAPNNFPTMLHRKSTNKITEVLVYAVLEWVLIFFLFVNSLFSYFICKFAKYFSLKPPCFLCSRLDHLLEPRNSSKVHTDLMCEAHATEFSSLSYCPNHKKLADFRNLCINCFDFKHMCKGKIIRLSPQVAVFAWIGENMAAIDGENERCSCCDATMSSAQLLKPSSGILEYAEKNDFINKVLKDIRQSDIHEDSCSKENELEEQPNVVNFSLGEAIKEYFSRSKSFYESDDIVEDTSHRDANAKSSGDVMTILMYFSRSKSFYESDDIVEDTSHRDANAKSSGDVMTILMYNIDDGESLEVMNMFTQSSGYSDDRINDTITITRPDLHMEEHRVGEHDDCLCDSDVDQGFTKPSDPSPVAAKEDGCDWSGEFVRAQTSIEEDSSKPEQSLPVDNMQESNTSINNENVEIIAELDASTSHIDRGSEEPEERGAEAEECWDGSTITEVEGEDKDSKLEKLKSALKAQHHALRSLQTELEEERNAAAIATNETMAMITRLQEEKSAVQMEALHYQRMMEEQSEYDQEALQIFNDLMIKREKEKLEIEKDLEMYRKRVSDYEAKEKMAMMRKSTSSSRDSTASSSTMYDDDDQLFIDLIHEEKVDVDCSNVNIGNVVLEMEEDPQECAKHLSILDESIAQFEDERISILEELKSLEQKLFVMADDEEEAFEDMKVNNQNRSLYGQELDESTPDENSLLTKDFTGEMRSEKEKVIGSTAKTLLPLFDATSFESEGEMNEDDVKSESARTRISLGNKYNMEDSKTSIEEEVDHVYRRLQALEADKDFLQHCFNSLRKGEKGREILEEILEHLCDLRTVELQVRNCGDSPFLL